MTLDITSRKLGADAGDIEFCLGMHAPGWADAAKPLTGDWRGVNTGYGYVAVSPDACYDWKVVNDPNAQLAERMATAAAKRG